MKKIFNLQKVLPFFNKTGNIFVYANLVFSSFVFTNSVFAEKKSQNKTTEKEEFNARDMILHHIKDSHEWHLFDIPKKNGEKKSISVALPIIIYYNGSLDIFLSSSFHHGKQAVKKGENTYVIYHDKIYIANEQGKLSFTKVGSLLPTNAKPLDFSITKNVVTMFLSMLLLLWIFTSVAKSYKKIGGSPKGIGSFLEPIIIFVRDDIAKLNIKNGKHKKYLPFLLTVFFFIWINNLIGLVPILSPNLTGNISVTMVLALITLLITSFSANKNYWRHIFVPPVTKWLYIIMIPIEITGIFTKPFALMIRLFANITAGHILILSLVSIIFIFKSIAMSAVSIPFIVFMNTLELLVGVLQAYIFTLLSALFIGMAVEEKH